MENEYLFRHAIMSDMSPVWEIILQAKARMRYWGSTQWQDGYPTLTHIASDIARRTGFVLCRKGKEDVIAYGTISVNDEPAYEILEGKWLSDRSYIVVHRLAVIDKMKNEGIATHFFECAEKYARTKDIHSFRVDTNYDNVYMLRLIEKRGFTYCGKVSYGIRGERLAFEKII